VFIDTPALPPGPVEGPVLLAGARLGAYEVIGLVGAGGMGEVYRARDARLGRDVAIKVLPRDFCRDRDRLRRFEQEARAAGMLDHPNVVALHDMGSHEGAPYVVSELLEGETLRERMRGTVLGVRKAIDYAVQVAQGLAAAHEKGIVHRDLKPENLFVTRDGRVKILDFGLAKLRPPLASAGKGVSAPGGAEEATAPGTLLGTIGYMAPEQIRGEEATPRSDLFSFGAILYEMLTGRRAFDGDTPADTLSAILKNDPPDIAESGSPAPPALSRIVRRCLEKTPDERFQSARDLAFALQTIAAPSDAVPARTAAATAWTGARGLALLLAALALAGGAYRLGGRMAERPIPSFHPLTFRRGSVESARFSPDGSSVLYGAAWEGHPAEVFSMRLDGVEARALGLPRARLLATAPGEMAVLLRGEAGGMLARLPLEGGAPREVKGDVIDADWTPDATRFAVVRSLGGRTRLEFPIGRVVYETAGAIVSPRVAPDGKHVAFIDQPMLGNTPGTVDVVDTTGWQRTLSKGWTDTGGLAWSPAGDEVWFTAAAGSTSRSLHAVSLFGRYRLVAKTPGAMVLQDISRTGRVLLAHALPRSEPIGRIAGEAGERDLSWFDWTHVSDFTSDGRVLFTAEGEGGGPLYTVYLRKGLDSTPVRLGEGHATELSPDGAWALVLLRTSPPELRLLPTGPGEPRSLPREDGIVEYHWAWWFPDGKRVLFLANKAGRPAQLFVQDLNGGRPQAFAPEGVTAYRHRPISPDGRTVVALVPGETGTAFALLDVEGGASRPVIGLDPRERPIRWSGDGRSLFIRARGVALPVRVDRLDLASGRRVFWRDVSPADPAGVETIGDIVLSADGTSYVVSCSRTLSGLYVVDGLK
jgi:Tol biopolymer transport system component